MTLLWANSLMMAAASTIWLLWTLKWHRRRKPLFALLYFVSAVGCAATALNYFFLIWSGDPTPSAQGARAWVWATIFLPSVVRLMELLRDERREQFADAIVRRVELKEARRSSGTVPSGGHR
jgi:hypothetical protein